MKAKAERMKSSEACLSYNMSLNRRKSRYFGSFSVSRQLVGTVQYSFLEENERKNRPAARYSPPSCRLRETMDAILTRTSKRTPQSNFTPKSSGKHFALTFTRAIYPHFSVPLSLDVVFLDALTDARARKVKSQRVRGRAGG